MRPPRKSISTGTRHLTQKRCRSVQNCGLQRRARNSIKKINNPSWPSHFTPLPGRPCGADFYHFWHVVSYRRRNHPRQILSRLVKGLGLRLPKIGGFPLTLNVALTTVLRNNVLHCDYRGHVTCDTHVVAKVINAPGQHSRCEATDQNLKSLAQIVLKIFWIVCQKI